MTIYEQFIEKVTNGSEFKTSFENKSLKVDGRYVIKNGKSVDNMRLIDFDGDTYAEIERLYIEYKHSMPTERSEKNRKTYFKALSSEELTDEEMIFGEVRAVAQARLEGFVLCMSLLGKIEIADSKWFWQGKDKDLIILKNWI